MNGLVGTDLRRSFGDTQAVAGVTLRVAPGERVAVVGGSGSGKSSLLRLLLALDWPDSGVVTLDRTPVQPGSPRALRWYRRRVQYIPQDPATSLDPRRTALDLVAQPLHLLGFGCDHRSMAETALRNVGLGPEHCARKPAQLSGGQNQRVAIARAIVCEPDYLLADEPVSGLDLAIREQVLDTLDALCDRTSTALVMVSHDLSVVARSCRHVAVLHRGAVVEYGPTSEVLTAPTQPYTRSLLDAVPRLPVS